MSDAVHPSRQDARVPPAVAAFADAVLTLAMAVVMTSAPILAHVVHPVAGILTALLLGGLVAWRMPQVSVAAVIFSLLFQNLFVALVANTIDTDEEFNFIRGYNFVMLAVSWLVISGRFLLDWGRRNRALDPVVLGSAIVFGVVGLYFLIGFAQYGMTAIVYLRNIVTPLLLFHICLLTFARFPVRLDATLGILTALIVFCGFYEFLARDSWLAVTNSHAFWERSIRPNWQTLAYDDVFAKTGLVWTGLLDSFRITLFNSPLLAGYDIQILRMYGPNMHAISFAYAISFLSLFSLYRGRFGLAAPLFVLLVLSSAKGPLIVYLMVAGSFMVSRLFGMRFAFLLHGAMLAVYAVVGIVVGRSIGDYHVLGLTGGLYEFFANPIGRGIGAGGNLSSEFRSIDWEAAQHAGRTAFAVESSIGVLLYQMGVFAAVVVGFFGWLSWKLMQIARVTGNSLHAAATFLLFSMVVSGLFQEEAYFSPLALGLVMALTGMIMGAAARTGVLARTNARIEAAPKSLS